MRVAGRFIIGLLCRKIGPAAPACLWGFCNEVNVNHLDARGLRCPMPLLKLKQRLNSMQGGEEITVATTDPGSVRDFQAFLRQAGHALLEVREEEAGFLFHIRKAG
jgi:tRNA 2-thiouridine synthesizing protein A